jgi:putative salt-induced outer membrane protein YdiY
MSKKMKLFSLILSLSFPIFLVCVGIVWADKIILENGDSLTGTIVKAEGGKLILKTDYSTPIEIEMAKIKKIVSDNPVEVHLTDSEVLKGKLKTSEAGQVGVERTEEKETTTIDWKKVVSINPPPQIPPKWHGNITLGANSQKGNTDIKNASVSAEAVKRTERDRFSLRYLFNYAEEDKKITTRSHYGAMKYDYFFTKKLYGYVGAELLNDKFKDLSLRTIVGPGVGYQIWEDAIKSLQVEAGVSYTNENRREGEDKSWISARLGGILSYNIFNFVTFSDRFVIYPNLEHSGEFQLRNEAALTKSLGSRWALRLANIIEHDSDPTPGFKKNDIYWILSLQYSF